MITQRPATNVTRPTGAGKPPEPDLTAPDVLRQALVALEQHVPLPRPPEADDSPAEISSVLLYAAIAPPSSKAAPLWNRRPTPTPSETLLLPWK